MTGPGVQDRGRRARSIFALAFAQGWHSFPFARNGRGLALITMALATSLQAAGDKKRQEPPSVPPIEHQGVRYEAVPSGPRLGYSQDGGILAARDARTGELQWSRRIYPVHYDGSIESDKQEVFISAMSLSEDGDRILIVNEQGRRFQLMLGTCAVIPIGDPDPGQATHR